jgi:MoaA/NifB/PqqE/SkfB family radical SAM enzyme
VHSSQIFQAWGKILKGERPSLSIEITRECPLKCPGCYAYDDAHLGGVQKLRDLNDRRGQSLVQGVLEVVDRLKPLHLSIVGGDPLVRFRELELLILTKYKRAPLRTWLNILDDFIFVWWPNNELPLF